MEQFYELSRDSISRAQAWYKNNDDCPTHYHSSIELVYLLSGEMNAVLNGVSHIVGKHTLIVNSCYQTHAYHSRTPSSEIVATVPLSILTVFGGQLSHQCFRQNIVPSSPGSEYEQLMRMMADQRGTDNEAYVNSLAQALIALLSERVGLSERREPSDDDWLMRVLSYLQRNAFSPLTVNEVASVFGYSAGRFSHRFTQQAGTSFLQYLQMLRCEQARMELQEGKLPISEIAAKCGFSSVRSFHRIFKLQTGQTPLQARKTKGVRPNISE